MFKMIGWMIKTSLFALAILVLGSMIRWNGETLSDQVKTGIAHAEPSRVAEKIKRWASGLVDDARDTARRAVGSQNPSRRERYRRPQAEAIEAAAEEDGDISPTERQKLRALIEELNRN